MKLSYNSSNHKFQFEFDFSKPYERQLHYCVKELLKIESIPKHTVISDFVKLALENAINMPVDTGAVENTLNSTSTSSSAENIIEITAKDLNENHEKAIVLALAAFAPEYKDDLLDPSSVFRRVKIPPYTETKELDKPAWPFTSAKEIESAILKVFKSNNSSNTHSRSLSLSPQPRSRRLSSSSKRGRISRTFLSVMNLEDALFLEVCDFVYKDLNSLYETSSSSDSDSKSISELDSMTVYLHQLSKTLESLPEDVEKVQEAKKTIQYLLARRWAWQGGSEQSSFLRKHPQSEKPLSWYEKLGGDLTQIQTKSSTTLGLGLFVPPPSARRSIEPSPKADTKSPSSPSKRRTKLVRRGSKLMSNLFHHNKDSAHQSTAEQYTEVQPSTSQKPSST